MPVNVCPMDGAEFGEPAWALGAAPFAFLPGGQLLLCSFHGPAIDGSRMGLLDVSTGGGNEEVGLVCRSGCGICCAFVSLCLLCWWRGRETDGRSDLPAGLSISVIGRSPSVSILCLSCKILEGWVGLLRQMSAQY